MWSSGEVLPTRVRLAWWKTDARPTSCIYYCKNLFQSQDPYINSPSCLLFLSTFGYENLVFTWNSFPKLTLFFLLEYVLILYGEILLWSLLGRVTGVVHGKNPESLWGIHFTLQSPTTEPQTLWWARPIATNASRILLRSAISIPPCFVGRISKRMRNPKVWGSIPHGYSEYFLCLTLVTRRRHSSLSLPRSTRAGFAPRNTFIVAGLNELNSSFRALLSDCNSSLQSRWPALCSSVNIHP